MAYKTWITNETLRTKANGFLDEPCSHRQAAWFPRKRISLLAKGWKSIGLNIEWGMHHHWDWIPYWIFQKVINTSGFSLEYIFGWIGSQRQSCGFPTVSNRLGEVFGVFCGKLFENHPSLFRKMIPRGTCNFLCLNFKSKRDLHMLAGDLHIWLQCRTVWTKSQYYAGCREPHLNLNQLLMLGSTPLSILRTGEMCEILYHFALRWS